MMLLGASGVSERARRHWFWVLVTIGLAIRLGVAVAPVELIDRVFLTDDSYIALNISRNLARD